MTEREIIGYIFMGIGMVFNLTGAIGLFRLPDVYNRLQASTKNVTLGTISVLVGAIIISGISSIGAKSLLAAVFIVLTSPVSAHVLARASHIYGIPLCKGSVIDRYADDYQKNAGEKKI